MRMIAGSMFPVRILVRVCPGLSRWELVLTSVYRMLVQVWIGALASSTLLGAALAGLVSAGFMTLFEFPFWRRWGMNGVAEWQSNWIIISKLTRGNSSKIRKPRISWTVSLHLWHGVAAGIVFALILPYLTLILAGNFSVLVDAVVYSVALWVIFMLAFRRAFESAGGVRISDRSLSIALASHFVYGIFLGLLIPLA